MCFFFRNLVVFTLSCFFFVGCVHQQFYPKHWWQPIAKTNLASWEIAPNEVQKPEVILSKRNELGLLSNFAPTPFVFEDKRYASVEGFWQSLKYPEDAQDTRASLDQWPWTREQVEQMTGFAAKRAGDFASQVMKKHNINWVSYKGKKMLYRQQGISPFYKLIRKAMVAKLKQNNEVKTLLLKTGQLILKPDHLQGADVPKAWRYSEIYMDFRSQLQRGNNVH